MIRVICKTYIDHPKGFIWHFPNYLACRPQVGDLVESFNSDEPLKICSIIHKRMISSLSDDETFKDDGIEYVPALEIRLTRSTI